MKIDYGISPNYLNNWDINDALREIFQNFIDYGKYNIKTKSLKNNQIEVSISNDYIPTDFEFLRIGDSYKNNNNNAIGKHGEGLKMALLIFLRNNQYITIHYKNTLIYPKWNNQIIGKTFCLEVLDNVLYNNNFSINFRINSQIYKEFYNNILQDSDIIYIDNYHGKIVNKQKGNLYSGGLFVTNIKELTKSYDISPSLLSLDRDRKIPSSFEVSYHTSKINESYLKNNEIIEAKLNFKDINFNE